MTLQTRKNGLDGTTTVNIVHNKKFDAIEIDFNGKKPVELVRNWLKKNCFRWNPDTKVWYIPFTQDRHENILFIFQNRTFETEDLQPIPDEKNQNNAKTTPKQRQIAKQYILDLKHKTPLFDKKEDVEIEIEQKETKNNTSFVAKVTNPISEATSQKLFTKARKNNAKIKGKTFTFATKKDLNNFVKPEKEKTLLEQLQAFIPTFEQFDFALHEKAYRGTSFDPEKRAKQDIEGQISDLKSVAKQLNDVKNKSDFPIVASFENFVKKYLEKTRELTHSRSRMMSTMITGRGNFPVERQNKINEAHHKKLEAYLDWHKKAVQKLLNEFNQDFINKAIDNAPIVVGESNSLQKLQAKLKTLEDTQKNMIETNKLYRTKKKGIQYEGFELTNNRAKINAVKEQISTHLREEQKRAISKDIFFAGGYITENAKENRLQIIFDDKPNKQLIEKLKKHGLKWSPKNAAWQRQLTENARYSIIKSPNSLLKLELGGEIKQESKQDVEIEIEQKETKNNTSFVAKVVNPISQTTSQKLFTKARKNNAKIKGKTFTFATKKDLNNFVKSEGNSQQEVISIPLSNIHTNKKLFQNREDDFSKESVNRIVKAVENQTFNWQMLDPILTWKNPKDGKLYVLSGHSRTEAFKHLASKKVTYKGKKFDSIPAKIIETTQEEAVQIALNSNTLSTKETDIERANYYRNLRNKGKSKKDILALATENEGKNARKILNLSYLNEKGEILSLLKNFADSDITNKGTLETIADWVGEAREKFTDLTNSHENELSKWLINTAYGTKTGQFTNKKAFYERLNIAIQRKTTFGKFDAESPLNMEKSVFKNNIEQEFDAQTYELKKEVSEAEKELKKVSDNAYLLLEQGKTTQKRVNEVVAEKTKIFTLAKNKLQAHLIKKNDILAQSKQQTSLFGISKKVVSARELSKKKFQEYEFKGKYLQLMGKPSEGFRMMLHGMPGGGKTTFLLQFSKYLCNNFGNVLYVSKEEFGSSTLTQKINKHLRPIPHNIDFSENVENIDLNKYNFVVLDSINDLGMDLKAFKELKDKYPKTAFILILQCTKGGQFKGGKEWEHEVEIGAKIEKAGVISVYKNRFDVKGELNFFDE